MFTPKWFALQTPGGSAERFIGERESHQSCVLLLDGETTDTTEDGLSRGSETTLWLVTIGGYKEGELAQKVVLWKLSGALNVMSPPTGEFRPKKPGNEEEDEEEEDVAEDVEHVESFPPEATIASHLPFFEIDGSPSTCFEKDAFSLATSSSGQFALMYGGLNSDYEYTDEVVVVKLLPNPTGGNQANRNRLVNVPTVVGSSAVNLGTSPGKRARHSACLVDHGYNPATCKANCGEGTFPTVYIFGGELSDGSYSNELFSGNFLSAPDETAGPKVVWRKISGAGDGRICPCPRFLATLTPISCRGECTGELVIVGGASFPEAGNLESLSDCYTFDLMHHQWKCLSGNDDGHRCTKEVRSPGGFPRVNGHVASELRRHDGVSCRSSLLITGGKDKAEGCDDVFLAELFETGDCEGRDQSLMIKRATSASGVCPHWRYTASIAQANLSDCVQNSWETVRSTTELERRFGRMNDETMVYFLVGGNCRHAEGPAVWILLL